MIRPKKYSTQAELLFLTSRCGPKLDRLGPISPERKTSRQPASQARRNPPPLGSSRSPRPRLPLDESLDFLLAREARPQPQSSRKPASNPAERSGFEKRKGLLYREYLGKNIRHLQMLTPDIKAPPPSLLQRRYKIPSDTRGVVPIIVHPRSTKGERESKMSDTTRRLLSTTAELPESCDLPTTRVTDRSRKAGEQLRVKRRIDLPQEISILNRLTDIEPDPTAMAAQKVRVKMNRSVQSSARSRGKLTIKTLKHVLQFGSPSSSVQSTRPVSRLLLDTEICWSTAATFRKHSRE